MKMGPITAIQDHSPAAEAGLKAGDQIMAIDGHPVGDPLTLPERMRRKAGHCGRFGDRAQGGGRAGRAGRKGRSNPASPIGGTIREPPAVRWR